MQGAAAGRQGQEAQGDAAGVKTFERQDQKSEAAAVAEANSKNPPCPFRVTHDGLALLAPLLRKQVVRPTALEMLALLEGRAVALAEEARVGLSEKEEGEEEEKKKEGEVGEEGRRRSRSRRGRRSCCPSAAAQARRPLERRRHGRRGRGMRHRRLRRLPAPRGRRGARRRQKRQERQERRRRKRKRRGSKRRRFRGSSRRRGARHGLLARQRVGHRACDPQRVLGLRAQAAGGAGGRRRGGPDAGAAGAEDGKDRERARYETGGERGSKEEALPPPPGAPPPPHRREFFAAFFFSFEISFWFSSLSVFFVVASALFDCVPGEKKIGRATFTHELKKEEETVFPPLFFF